jgi:hypothetical protein
VLSGAAFTWLLSLLEMVLPGVALSYCCSRRWRLFGGVKPPGAAPGSPGVSRTRFQDWAVTDVPRYPRYKTSIVAHEPFVERVVRAIRSMRGRAGTHMLLRVPSQDRVATMGRHDMTGVVMWDQSWDL